MYEPKIFGFNIHGKRGSKFFEPAKGTIKYIEDSLQQMEKEKLYQQLKDSNSRANTLFTAPLESLTSSKENKSINVQQPKREEEKRGR